MNSGLVDSRCSYRVSGYGYRRGKAEALVLRKWTWPKLARILLSVD
jgi:hypothetical protein